MDWKVRRTSLPAHGEIGTEIIHFEHAFHGRTGYTLSLTKYRARKTDLFAKFAWPRITAPSVGFFPAHRRAEPPRKRLYAQEARSRRKIKIRQIILKRGEHIAALLLNPFNTRMSGTCHFAGEYIFCKTLRTYLRMKMNILLIFR